MSNYLLMEINLKKFNANSGFYTIGLPALTAFAGFFHNIQRKIDTELKVNNVEGNITIQDFAILAKNIYVREGHPKYVKGLKSSDKLTTPASTIDEKIADGEFCFIVRYEENIDSLEYAGLKAKDFSSFFERLIQNTKIAGGHFTLLKNFNKNKGLITSNDFNEINKTIKNKSYFYLVDEYEKLENINFEQYVELISRSSLKEKARKEGILLEEKPYYIPLVPGYHLLEKPSNKINSVLRNQNYQHAFAEPILSLGRFQTVNSVLYNSIPKNEAETNIEKNSPKIFWNYKTDNNFYYVAAKSLN